MTSDTLIRTRNFILVLLVQIFIFGQIHLFGYATAYIPLLFILKLPRYTSHNALLALNKPHDLFLVPCSFLSLFPETVIH